MDILTKALPRDAFDRHSEGMGMTTGCKEKKGGCDLLSFLFCIVLPIVHYLSFHSVFCSSSEARRGVGR